MTRKWQLKERARELRKKGFSYSEIIKQIPVSKSTISFWCRDIKLTKKQITRLGSLYDTQFRGAKANQLKRKKEIEIIRKNAKKEIKKLSNYEIKIIGAALYWAEGSKVKSSSFTNSDPLLIKFIMKWYRDVCKVPENKIKPYLHLHTGLDEKKAKKYWSKIISIPVNRFGSTFFKKEGTGHRKNKLYNGTLRIQVNSEDLRHKILAWVEKICNYIN
jgi:transcriptional regulator with XRE-family HTH domain